MALAVISEARTNVSMTHQRLTIDDCGRDRLSVIAKVTVTNQEIGFVNAELDSPGVLSERE